MFPFANQTSFTNVSKRRLFEDLYHGRELFPSLFETQELGLQKFLKLCRGYLVPSWYRRPFTGLGNR